MTKRTYSELSKLETFEDRFRYLKIGGGVGDATFGFDRYINQKFYSSAEWKNARNYVILRDEACDLGIKDRRINGSLLVHHMNPMTPDDIIHGEDWIFDPEFLITTTQLTHNAIHYGDESKLVKQFTARKPGDTKLW